MAVDTAEKRLSMMDMGPPIAPALPVPSGIINLDQKLHLLWLYSGIGPDVVVIVPSISPRIVYLPARSRTVYVPEPEADA